MIQIEEYIKLSKQERQKHLDLNEPCEERGTISTHCRGILAKFLDTNVNVKTKPWVDLCHACNNPNCSNPKHLYWGTRAENMEDLKNTGYIPKGNPGKNNPFYGVKPWRNPMNIKGYGTADSWIKAQYIFDNYVENGWSFSQYGKGYTHFVTKYKIKQGVARTMIKMFKNNWNPNLDDDYQKFLNENK